MGCHGPRPAVDLGMRKRGVKEFAADQRGGGLSVMTMLTDLGWKHGVSHRQDT